MYWKKLAINMHLVSQVLFVMNTIWDFFLTIIVHSFRSGIFDIIPGIAIYIIIPWILVIFILSILGIISVITEDRLVVRYDSYGYIIITIIYIALFALSIFTPSMSWPFILNYAVNAAWASSLIYFKSKIIKAK